MPLPCRSKPISALACRSKARVTTPLPILALLRLCRAIFALPLLCETLPLRRFSPQFLSIALPRFSVANIASHAAARPDYSLPLRGTSNLYSAVATNCIAKPLLRYAAPSHALATHSSRSLCRTLRCNTTPLLRFATPRRCRSMPVLAARRHASPSRNYAVPRLSVAPRREAVRCRAFPSLSSRIDAQPLPHNSIHSHCTSLPLHAAPLLCCADHGHSRPRHRAYSSTS